MDKLFNPTTIALIGASEKEGSVGRAIMNNLLSSIDIKLFPVNIERKEVLGVKCYPNVSTIPVNIDLS
ncbi:MAG TPA: CoA-binding protein, partial [Sulfurovum sp.]